MRVNIYAEEMTERVEIIEKEIEGQRFTGLRLYLELPCTLPSGKNVRGPFMHHPGDDDSAAITFWGKRDLRTVLHKMLNQLDLHYKELPPMTDPEQRKRDIERAATCMAHDPGCSVSVNIGATVNAIADALAAARREVWQRVLDLAAEQDIDVAAFAAIDADPRDIADPLKAAALAILRAAAEGAKP